VSRSPLLVRDAVEDDAAALSRLWSELVDTGPESSGESPEELTARSVVRAQGDPTTRILVAEVDGAVVGCAYLRTPQVSPLHEERIMHVSHLQADAGEGRDGIQRALLECSVTWAEQRGVETLVTATAARDKDANRFLARLGLAQAVVLRTASVAALRARLPHDPSGAARTAARTSRSVGQVVAARRSQRRARNRQLLT
jgi:N-acetylglutamate synthase-like GNAT family acetyltransferase